MFGLPAVTVGEYRLKVGQQIDEDELRQIADAADREEAWTRGLDYASRSMRTQKEVGSYLISKGYSQSVAAETCCKLREYGYLNEADYIRAYIADHADQWGVKKIVYELSAKGLPATLIEQATEVLDQTEACKRLAKKALDRTIADQSGIQKVMRHLLSKGFDWDTVKEAVNSCLETAYDQGDTQDTL